MMFLRDLASGHERAMAADKVPTLRTLLEAQGCIPLVRSLERAQVLAFSAMFK